MASFHFLECIRRGKIFPVARQLQNGANPNMNYCGVTPLQLAIEVDDEDMVAFLLHWGAETTDTKGRKDLKETAKQFKNPTVIKLLEGDKELLKKKIEILQVKMERDALKMREQGRKDLVKNILFFFFLAVLTVAGMHGLAIYSPVWANKMIPRKLLTHLHTLSPYLDEWKLPSGSRS